MNFYLDLIWGGGGDTSPNVYWVRTPRHDFCYSFLEISSLLKKLLAPHDSRR